MPKHKLEKGLGKGGKGLGKAMGKVRPICCLYNIVNFWHINRKSGRPWYLTTRERAPNALWHLSVYVYVFFLSREKGREFAADYIILTNQEIIIMIIIIIMFNDTIKLFQKEANPRV